jgi:DNA-binding beta-propeller fold protein YncE
MKPEQKQWLRLVLGLVLGLFVVSCDDDDDAGGETGAVTHAAIVVTTDYETGYYSTVSLDDYAVNKDIAVIHSDAVCHTDTATGLSFLVLRWGGDSIAVLDQANGLRISTEYSVGAGTNPQDIAVVSPERAYISRFADTEMLIVHPTEGSVIGTVDFTAYADADGLPEVAGLLYLDGKVYVAVQRIDPAFVPVGGSLVVVIDALTGKVEEEIELTATNPGVDLRYNSTLDRIVIVETGAYGVAEGGVEFLNPADNTLSGLVITEETLGGDVVDVMIISETKGYAIVDIVRNTVSTTDVVIFDPSTGEKTRDLLVSDELVYSTLAVTPDGAELWVGDRTMDNPGIRIFDIATDTEVTTEPVYVGLPPTSICFIE